MKPSITVMLLTLVSPWVAAEQTGPVAVSERDFMNDIPVVLSVSRLAQPVDEAPGAVTILDRHFIRISGARDITDLLRLVPGFQTTTSFETDAPMASYHGRNDDWANRIQVLVDQAPRMALAPDADVAVAVDPERTPPVRPPAP